ncbi:hypothetical protein ACHAXS_004902 [Conticribra weissflogii]
MTMTSPRLLPPQPPLPHSLQETPQGQPPLKFGEEALSNVSIMPQSNDTSPSSLERSNETSHHHPAIKPHVPPAALAPETATASAAINDTTAPSTSNAALPPQSLQNETELWIVSRNNHRDGRRNNFSDDFGGDLAGDGSGNCNQLRISSLEQLKLAITLLEGQHQFQSSETIGDGINNKHNNSKNHHQKEDNEEGNMTDSDPLNNFSSRTHTTQQAFLDEVKRFELFRSVIQHEDDLLNQRVSWIILAQSFLMAAFITSSDGSDALKYITATVGLLTVVVTFPAILAAGRNIELQQHVYFAGLSSEERCRELHGHGRDWHFGDKGKGYGSTAHEQYRRMKYGHIFPNMAFRGRGSMPILITVVGLVIVQILGWCFLLAALVNGW